MFNVIASNPVASYTVHTHHSSEPHETLDHRPVIFESAGDYTGRCATIYNIFIHNVMYATSRETATNIFSH